METFENIRLLREMRGMSQETLAEMTGYRDRSSIAKIEAGLVDLSESKIAAFAKALSVSPAELMGFSVDTSPAKETTAPLAPDEQQLINDYRRLSTAGKEYILQTMAMALRSYSEKNNASSDLEKAN